MKKRWTRLLAATVLAALLAPGMVYATPEDGAPEGTPVNEAESSVEEGAQTDGEEENEVQAGPESGGEKKEPRQALREALEKSPFAEDELIAEGIYIDKFDVGKMTASEALETLLSYVEETGKKTLTVTLEGAEDIEPIQTTVGELGLHTDDLAGIVMEALTLGKGGNLIVRYMAEKDLQVSNQVYEFGMAIDENQLGQFVTEQTEGLSVDPVNAEITKTGDGFSVSESKVGIQVDVPATVSAAKEAFKNWNRESVALTAVAEIIQPKRSTQQLSQIQDPIGKFSTENKDRTSGKLQNLQRGVDLTDDVLLMPGESWSMHDALAPFTAENGYTQQIAYQDGGYVQEYGGGICQLATTLYNAALRAEMYISKRSNHSMTVGYTIKGLDATINDGGSKDLELTNDFDFPIYIESSHDGSGTVTYTIWGKETRPSNRTLKFTNVILSEEYLPEEVTVDPNMAPGTQKVKQSTSYPKATVEAYKEIYVDGVLQEKIRLHTDKYVASARKVVKGPDVSIDPSTGLPVGAEPSTEPNEPTTQPPESGESQPETSAPETQAPEG
ncbi:MAG: hypothetical protein HFI63_02335 [Lachnospiraceae bacterium]|nr:hypothetical protein [Lachnospiraceae bacterium]